jgi:hypothetical protein
VAVSYVRELATALASGDGACCASAPTFLACGRGEEGDTMGDKGGKKDKEKGQKQHTDKKQHEAKIKQDKLPKRKTG